MSASPALSVRHFSRASAPDLVLACQRLRYEIYHGELGYDGSAMDHARRLDIEAPDEHADFFAVLKGDEVVGCVRTEEAQGSPLHAEQEFVLRGPWWRERRLIEGSRFAVKSAHRNGEVPVMLVDAFRRHCRARGIDHLVSISIIPDRAFDRGVALGALRWLAARVKVNLTLARPAPALDVPGLSTDDVAGAPEIEASRLPPMVHMLATRRTTLCSLPGFCRQFSTWNYLLVTRLARGAGSEGDPA